MLAGSRRATDPRHRTLRDLVQWSYDLLTPVEQRLFDRLSVFAGSFVLERAERVCAGDGIDERDVAGLLGVLVDKSMLVAAAVGSRARYRLLETLREFGREQLAASPECRRRSAPRTPPVHAELADDAARGPRRSRRSRSGWRSSTPRFDDLREAARRRRRRRRRRPARCASWSALREYAWRRIRYELLAWADATVAMPGAAEHPLYPRRCSASSAYGHFVRGELDAARSRSGERAVAAAERLGVAHRRAWPSGRSATRSSTCGARPRRSR